MKGFELIRMLMEEGAILKRAEYEYTASNEEFLGNLVVRYDNEYHELIKKGWGSDMWNAERLFTSIVTHPQFWKIATDIYDRTE